MDKAILWKGKLHRKSQLITNYDNVNKMDCSVEFVHDCSYLEIPDEAAIVTLLKTCMVEKNLQQGYRMHVNVLFSECHKSSTFVNNNLMNMYFRCGAIFEAQEVFDRLQLRNVVSYNVLIAGYAQKQFSNQAVKYFRLIMRESVIPNSVTLLSVLKAYAQLGAVEAGKQIHAQFQIQELPANDGVLGAALVDMYAKCGALEMAEKVFDELPLRDVVSWTTLIAGYAEHGYGEDALNAFKCMQCEGVPANSMTFTCILKACGILGATEEGKAVHAELIEEGILEKNNILNTAVICMYSNCGALPDAQNIFDRILVRDVVSWTAMIQAYAEYHYFDDALECFELMLQNGIGPIRTTFSCMLNICGIMAKVHKGRELHVEIVRKGLLGVHRVLDVALLDMYLDCSEFTKAEELFSKLPVLDVYLWNSLISGYVKHGYDEEAINIFQLMHYSDVSPNVTTFAFILDACGSMGAFEKGNEIHNQIIRAGLLKNDCTLGKSLFNMYSKCGAFPSAYYMLDNFPIESESSWTSLILGYAQHGYADKAIHCFKQMQKLGFFPSPRTLCGAVKACGTLGELRMGKIIHVGIQSEDLCQHDTILCTATLNMYLRCGSISDAKEVFDQLLLPDAVAWNALISGYVCYSHPMESLVCFHRMYQEGCLPDSSTMASILKACTNTVAPYKGKEIHAINYVNKKTFTEDFIVGTALVDMYMKHKELAMAQQIFNQLRVRDAVSWTSLISGYAENQFAEEAVNYFQQMQLELASPDALTFTCLLKAYGTLASAETGKEIHCEITRQGLLEKDCILGSALVAMYVKFGDLEKAQELFYDLPDRGAVSSWNSLIVGYGQLGDYCTAFALFRKMVQEGIQPDLVTFGILINVCSYSSLIGTGETWFELMSHKYGLCPSFQNHLCMVRFFAIVGEFKKAMVMVTKMTSIDHIPAGCVILDACKNWGNTQLSRILFEELLES